MRGTCNYRLNNIYYRQYMYYLHILIFAS